MGGREATVRVAVIGAGMAGRAHAAGYRNLRSTYHPPPADVELVAAADANTDFAEELRQRFGFSRAETRWEAVAEATDIDAVSVVLPNDQHLPVVSALLASGKHVLCEKPLAPDAVSALRLAVAARRAGVIAQVGFNHRQTPAIAAIRDLVRDGRTGQPLQLLSWYLSDHGRDPAIPFSWRHDISRAGGGSLIDIGAHQVDTARVLCGEIGAVRGGGLRTAVASRPVAAGATRGHERTAVSSQMRAVTTDDFATFVADFENGCLGTFTTSRIATGFKNSSGFHLVGREGSASFDWERVGEFGFADGSAPPALEGFTRVLVGPHHPYLAEGLVMPVAGVGLGIADTFVFQIRDFVAAIVAGAPHPDVATFDDGLANCLILDAVKRSAAQGGAEVRVAAVRAEAEAQLAGPDRPDQG